ncbi:glycosyltransferase N-terminal domain-containing protein [Acuticoccus sp. MNP-M23]|uniref:3-deoxy-D-manno-octulosonic acid transferase n=1 Tax=Acuticoccus sp. MNP-M23 TaxID=3072793 RepID=UPI002815EA89|nr:glycosyltransferase N-terminal domain-containing protein [Acuticoccus sp. MNP-M23]WMS44737.1 glycosyltransferase N-terminal domain-containing protein [Acuticoccus sp. MNP-M23]
MSFGTAVWAAYGAAGTLASPLAAAHLARRAGRGKEDAARSAEKRGIASAALETRPVWLHAVSLGETVAALTLAERIRNEGFDILLTTGTPTAAARAAGASVTHQYAPLDAPPFVARFLDHWRPAAALFVESEIWPTTLAALARRKVPRAHVNAHLSERSHRRWAQLPALSRPLFGSIPLALAQSEADAARFAALGVPHTATTGNLKFDAVVPEPAAEAVATLKAGLGGRPSWLAASIHPGEEAAVVAAHQQLAANIHGLTTFVAPRHMETAALVRRAAAAANVPIAGSRSAGDPPEPGLYLVDTLGELGVFFSVVPLVFLGGSLVPLGGHNPAEPASFGAALLTGPAHGSMFEPFLDAGAADVAGDAAALADKVAAGLGDPAAMAAQGAKARAVLGRERGATDRVMAELSGTLAAARALT